jgi:Co/Zn/Cd efflux system component
MSAMLGGVIILCGWMMLAEIAGGVIFGSIALVADGMHMSTHASALLLAALAYSYSRKHVTDGRFTFGTGKSEIWRVSAAPLCWQ